MDITNKQDKKLSLFEKIPKCLITIISIYFNILDYEFNDTNLDHIKYLYTNFQSNINININTTINIQNKFHNICSNNQIETIKWWSTLYDFKNMDFKPTLKKLSINNYVRIADWLIEKYQIDRTIIVSNCNLTFRSACKFGSFEFLEFLYNKFTITKNEVLMENSDAFTQSCKNNHINVVKWLITKFDLLEFEINTNNNYIYYIICKNGYIELALLLNDIYQQFVLFLL